MRTSDFSQHLVISRHLSGVTEFKLYTLRGVYEGEGREVNPRECKGRPGTTLQMSLRVNVRKS